MTVGESLNLNDSDVKIQIEPAKKTGKAYYKFIRNNDLIQEMEGVVPTRLSTRSDIAKKIKKELNINGRLNKEAVEEDYEDTILILQEDYESQLLNNKRLKEEEEVEKAQKMKFLKEKADKKLQSLDNPVVWIASVIDWLTAGERNNILLTFITFASQIILKNPISVVGLGDSGSGKTHVQQIGLSLIPDEFIVYEKKITEAALFRRSEKDPYFYDGKIVNYGDMGGEKDLDFAEESKNLMKELLSEGYLNKPLNVPNGEGGFEVRDLELYGSPALTYTTIPGYKFDEQEMSRSIFITPRMDNQTIYSEMVTYLEFKGKTYAEMSKYKKESELIKYMVYILREKFEDIEIINPYVHIVIEYLEKSKYFKRDFPKYNNLLKTITALGYYTHKVQKLEEGHKVMFVTLDDVQLFMSLLHEYHLSISANLSLKASEILKDLTKNIGKWVSYEDLDSIAGISVNEYLEKSNTNLSKKSTRTYFSELNQKGFIKIVDTKGRTNYWNLTNKQELKNKKNLLDINKDEKKRAEKEIDADVEEFFKNDNATNDLNIMTQYESVNVPPWNKV